MPLWLYGVSSVPDAEVASEAGLEGIVVNYVMRMTGCQTLADISYEAIFAPLFSEV